jgi:hypothetical protein
VFIFEYVWNVENVGTLAAVGTLNGKKRPKHKRDYINSKGSSNIIGVQATVETQEL